MIFVPDCGWLATKSSVGGSMPSRIKRIRSSGSARLEQTGAGRKMPFL